MKKIIALCALLCGCSHAARDLGQVGQQPGMIVCAGKFTMSAVGEVYMFGANASITGDCGKGAYFGGGYPAQGTLPNAADTGSPTVKMPPIGPSPSTTPNGVGTVTTTGS